jgi:hypothetical protein
MPRCDVDVEGGVDDERGRLRNSEIVTAPNPIPMLVREPIAL